MARPDSPRARARLLATLPTLAEEHQDIKDSLDGRKFLEKHYLLCPPGEPPTHSLLSSCLHQISALAGMSKQAVNAIRSVAFLLEGMEGSQINNSLREALDSQMTEFTLYFKLLVKDVTERISEYAKATEEWMAAMPAPPSVQPGPPTGSYVSA